MPSPSKHGDNPPQKSKPTLRLRVLTAVWGEAYVRTFCDLTVRSLLAPGNLPEISAKHDVDYNIYTTAEDADRLRANPAFRRLAESTSVELLTFSPITIDPRLASSHWTLWRKGMRAAQKEGAILVTVAADHIFSRNTFTRWIDLFEAGYKAIHCPGIQVVRESVVPAMKADFPDAADAIDLSRDALHDLVFRHIHPSNIMMMRDSPRAMSHPEYQIRAMPGRGLAIRIIASHPVCIDPAHFTMRDDFCPLDKIEDIAFEPCVFASAEPIVKNLQEYFYPWRMDDTAISNYGRWMDVFVSPASMEESRNTTYLRFSHDGNPAPEHDCDLQSAAYVTQMKLVRAIYRLWRGLRDHGLSSAARFLAVAAMHGKLRRNVMLRTPATLFIPCNRAIEDMDPVQVTRLLADGGRELNALLRDLIAPASFRPGASGGTADGEPRILRGPIQIDDFTIYVVADILGSGAKSETGGRSSLFVKFRDDLGAWAKAAARRLARMQVQRLEGLREELRPFVAKWRNRAARGAHRPQVTDLHELMDDRMILTLDEIYGFYRDTTRPPDGHAPLPGQYFTQAAAALRTGYRGRLEDILVRHPDCTEALIEAARLHEEDAETETGTTRQGSLEKARAAYASATCGRPHLAFGPHDVDPRILAAMRQAQLLAGNGQLPAARQALEAVGQLSPLPWRYHFDLARLLAASGDAPAACTHFEACFRFDGVVRALPFLTRNKAKARLEDFFRN